ncbi:MAG: DUF5716 family protein [Clostridiales bacterium]|nr:DUF5716 family protein [Clostridiales bacterium]
MNWKQFKNLFKEKRASDSSFILGLDLGNATSAIAYFDMFTNSPEVIDISGGYGKPVAPTVMQYIPAAKEWVFGEYALLNRGVGNEITVMDLIQKLGSRNFIEIGGKAISIPNILGIFLKELISNCKSLNPKAEIAGIIVAVADFCTEDYLTELQLAFKIAGYEKELIEFVPERLCVFTEYFSHSAPKKSRALHLDFGGRGLRGGLYDITGSGECLILKNISFLDNADLSVNNVDAAVEELFGNIYSESNSEKKVGAASQIREQISNFAYQHKDVLFQKNILTKPLKLYFTFSHPPFQKSITKKDIDALIEPFVKKFKELLAEMFEKNLYDLTEKLNHEDVDTVICTGGGFEMLWARNVVSEVFPAAKIVNKKAKCTAALGASLIAAKRLGVIETANIKLEDRLKLKFDFGFLAKTDSKEKFIPLVERNSFWWQNIFSRRFLINEQTGENYTFEFLKRDENGEITKVRDFELEGLPKRPKAASFFDVSVVFEGYDNILLKVTDCGFGELFEKTNYAQEFRFSV